MQCYACGGHGHDSCDCIEDDACEGVDEQTSIVEKVEAAVLQAEAVAENRGEGWCAMTDASLRSMLRLCLHL